MNDEWWRAFLRLWQSEAQGGCGVANFPGTAALCVFELAEVRLRVVWKGKFPFCAQKVRGRAWGRGWNALWKMGVACVAGAKTTGARRIPSKGWEG